MFSLKKQILDATNRRSPLTFEGARLFLFLRSKPKVNCRPVAPADFGCNLNSTVSRPC
jgi:hypothetical protein